MKLHRFHLLNYPIVCWVIVNNWQWYTKLDLINVVSKSSRPNIYCLVSVSLVTKCHYTRYIVTTKGTSTILEIIWDNWLPLCWLFLFQNYLYRNSCIYRTHSVICSVYQYYRMWYLVVMNTYVFLNENYPYSSDTST